MKKVIATWHISYYLYLRSLFLVDTVDERIEFFETFLCSIDVNLMARTINEHNLGPLDLFGHRFLIPIVSRALIQE